MSQRFAHRTPIASATCHAMISAPTSRGTSLAAAVVDRDDQVPRHRGARGVVWRRPKGSRRPGLLIRSTSRSKPVVQDVARAGHERGQHRVTAREAVARPCAILIPPATTASADASMLWGRRMARWWARAHGAEHHGISRPISSLKPSGRIVVATEDAQNYRAFTCE